MQAFILMGKHKKEALQIQRSYFFHTKTNKRKIKFQSNSETTENNKWTKQTKNIISYYHGAGLFSPTAPPSGGDGELQVQPSEGKLRLA